MPEIGFSLMRNSSVQIPGVLRGCIDPLDPGIRLSLSWLMDLQRSAVLD